MTRRRLLVAAIAGAIAAGPGSRAADPEGAERRYAEALGLDERSAARARLLEEVVAADPTGPLADDALVELARAEGVPRWPEQIGKMTPAGLERAIPLLDRVLAGLADADRADEARYLRGLLAAEPLSGETLDAARGRLAAVLAGPDAGWDARARHATAWLDLLAGARDRASETFHRILVDEPEGEITSRARVGLARAILPDGRYGDAARLLQDAIDAGVAPDTPAEPWRELAVRSLLAELGATAAAAPRPVSKTKLPAEATAGIAVGADGGLVLGDRREDRVLALDADGGVRTAWDLVDLEVIAGDPSGGTWAVASGYVHRLVAGGQVQRVAATGEWSPVVDIAADASGTVWLLDRRGRIGRVAPGAMAPVAFWEGTAGRVTSLAWDGRRLVAGDPRSGVTLAIGPDGQSQPLGERGFARPEDVAADLTGRFAVLDPRAGYVYLHRPDGTVVDIYTFANDGIERPLAVAFGQDGALHVYDERGPLWVRRP
jgi:hypothetical protein